MDNFWKYFENKTGFNEFMWKDHNRKNWEKSLIGHMIEYLIEKKIDFLVDPFGWFSSEASIEGVYKYLEDKINIAAPESDKFESKTNKGRGFLRDSNKFD